MTDKVLLDNVVKSIERNRRLSLGLPVPIIRSDIPIGYKINNANPNEAIVDEIKYGLLIQARKYLRESPYAEVSTWLIKSGLPISHNGLYKMMHSRPPYTDDERQQYNSSPAS